MKQSRGHGIHSPFAYDLITHLLHTPYSFYAFHDIPQILNDAGIDHREHIAFHHLSFRLVRHLHAKEILEINAGKGVNTLFVAAPASDIRCTAIEEDQEAVATARRLQDKRGVKCEHLANLQECGEKQYDAIFIDTEGAIRATPDTLYHHSHADTFWVLHPLKSRESKQLWRNIVNDERSTIIFDRRETGIVFLRFSRHPSYYYV